MEIFIGEDNILNITKVYNSIKLVTEKKETLLICMRDSGFEFSYNGVKYEAKNDIIKKVEYVPNIKENFEYGVTHDHSDDMN